MVLRLIMLVSLCVVPCGCAVDLGAGAAKGSHPSATPETPMAAEAEPERVRKPRRVS